jgi:hypothetical protein
MIQFMTIVQKGLQAIQYSPSMYKIWIVSSAGRNYLKQRMLHES